MIDHYPPSVKLRALEPSRPMLRVLIVIVLLTPVLWAVLRWMKL